jgi:hypothetical protein
MGKEVGDGVILSMRVGSRVTLSGDFRQTGEKSPVQAINPCSFAI